MHNRPPTRVQESLKQQVILALEDVRMEILDAASRISESHCREMFLGSWCLLDLLAHLAGWDEANREAVREVMEGQLPSFYAHRDPDWRTYNAALVEKYRREGLNDQISLVRGSHFRLVEALKSVPAGAFNQDFGVRFRGYKVTVRRLMEAEAKDETIHLAQLREFEGSLSA